MSLEALLAAIGQQESGGYADPYKAVNRSSGALGKYQVMPANVASWTRRALGRSLTSQQFLASPAGQEAVARTILGGYYSKYGAEGAAAMWYSGQPDPNKTYGTPSVRSYVDSVLAKMRNLGTGTASPASPVGGLPVVGGLTEALGSVTHTVINIAVAAPFVLAGVVLIVVGVAHAAGGKTRRKR